jgi:hypothetical protein
VNYANRETADALWKSWQVYATEAEIQPGNRNEFSADLQARTFEKKRGTGGVWVYLGVCLKASDG